MPLETIGFPALGLGFIVGTYKVPLVASLAIIALILGASVVASIWKSNRVRPGAPKHAGAA